MIKEAIMKLAKGEEMCIRDRSNRQPGVRRVL